MTTNWLALGGILLICCALSGGADSPNPPSELLHPAGKNTPRPAHGLSYHLAGGSEKWDPDARARIVKAMDEAVAIYNQYGEFDKAVTANYSPGTPTADGNYSGWLNFGGQIGTRVALHEIAHALGVGTYQRWGEFAKDGKWTGQYAISQLHEIEGPTAELHCDRQHFWPYGLNYDTEVKEDSFRRHVLMVAALRADMGIGPIPHPKLAAFKAAQAQAADDRERFKKAEADFSAESKRVSSTLESQPDVIAAKDSVAKAEAACTAAREAALASFHESVQYQTLKAEIDEAQQKVDELKAADTMATSEYAQSASAALGAKGKLNKLESAMLASDPNVVAAKQLLADASQALTSARENILKRDPQWVATSDAYNAARTKLTAAEQALADAKKALANEKSGDALKF